MISLEPLYVALHKQGFDAQAEHVLVHGMPVRFLPSPNELSDTALETAVARDLEGVAFRVIDPEHLCALRLQAGGAKRRERVEVLKQSGVVDEDKLNVLLRRIRREAVMARRANRTRPTPEFLEHQARAKARWRREMAARPLRDKIKLLLEMQRRLHPILQRRRPLRWWEQPWDVERSQAIRADDRPGLASAAGRVG